MKKRYGNLFSDAFSITRSRNLILIFIGIVVALLAGRMVFLFDALVLILVVGLIVALLILRYPFLGMLLFVALIPLESTFDSIGGGEATITRLLGIYILALWVLRLLYKRRVYIFPAYGKWFVAFLAWALVSAAWATDSGLTLQAGLTLIQMFALCLLIHNEIKNQKQLGWMLAILMISCLLAAMMGYLRADLLTDKSLLSLGGGQGTKEFATVVGTAFLSGVILLSSNFSNKLKLFTPLIIVVCIYPLFASAERGVILGLGIGWLVNLLFRKGKIKNLVLTFLLGLVLYVAFYWISQRGMLTNFIIERFSLTSIMETGGTGRLDIWTVAWHMFTDHPVWGIGLGNFPNVYLRYAPSIITGTYASEAWQAHSDYIGILTELGSIGFFLFIGLLLSVWIQFIKMFRQSLPSSMSVVVPWLLGIWAYYLTVGLTSILIYRKFYWLIFALVGVTIRLYQEKVNQVTAD